MKLTFQCNSSDWKAQLPRNLVFGNWAFFMCGVCIRGRSRMFEGAKAVLGRRSSRAPARPGSHALARA